MAKHPSPLPELWSIVYISDGTKEAFIDLIPEDKKLNGNFVNHYSAEQAYYGTYSYYNTQLDDLLVILKKSSPITVTRTVKAYDYSLKTTLDTIRIS